MLANNRTALNAANVAADPAYYGSPTPEQLQAAFRQSERDYRSATERSVAGSGYVARIGDNISRMLGTSWNWRNVMISAVSAGAGSAAGAAVGGQAWAQAGNGMGERLAAGLAGSLTARALTGGNRGSFETVFASTLGNAIGESLAPRGVDWSQAPDESAAETARLDRSGNRYAAWPDQTDAETERLARSGNPYAAWPDQTDAESARLGRYENRARVLENMQRAWDAQDATRHAAFLKQQNAGAMAYRQQLAREAFNFGDGMEARDIRLNSFSYKSRLSAEMAKIDAQQAYRASLAKAPNMTAGTMVVSAPTLSVGEQALRNTWQYRQATSLSTAYVAGGQVAADTVLTAISLNQNLRTGDYRDAAVDGLSLAASFLPFKLGPSTLAATAERTMLTAELRAPTSLVPLDATVLQRSFGNVGNAVPEGLAYRLDLPEHLAGPEGFTKSGQLSGTHNLNNATAALDAKGASYTLMPTATDGILELSYSYVKPSSGKTITGSKTVYDPAVFSDQTMLDYSLGAGQQGWTRYLANPATTSFDVTHGGANFRVYVNVDQYGNPFIGNVHPIK